MVLIGFFFRIARLQVVSTDSSVYVQIDESICHQSAQVRADTTDVYYSYSYLLGSFTLIPQVWSRLSPNLNLIFSFSITQWLGTNLPAINKINFSSSTPKNKNNCRVSSFAKFLKSRKIIQRSSENLCESNWSYQWKRQPNSFAFSGRFHVP